jgi:hypothetical protein
LRYGIGQPRSDDLLSDLHGKLVAVSTRLRSPGRWRVSGATGIVQTALCATVMVILVVFASRAAQPTSQPDPVIEPNIKALFDQPTDLAHKVLPPRPDDSGPLGVVRCYYYSVFTVKELDYGDHGDTAISVTPASAGAPKPDCGKQNDRGEIILPGGAASYLIGAKEMFVYIASTMGADTLPFAIYDGRTGKRLYSDQSSNDSPKQLSIKDGVLTLTYAHGAQAGCSILAGGQTCWAQFAREAHLPQSIAKLPPPIPACEAGYAASTGSSRSTPSVIFYDVTMTLDKQGQVKVLSRGAISCSTQG